MEEGMMVMNGSKPTNHSDDELSRFIDLITNAIHSPIPSQRLVQASTISIPMEFISLADNDDEQHDSIRVDDNEEVDNNIGEELSHNGDNGDNMQVEIDQRDSDNEEGQGQGQGQETARIPSPVDQQPNSSQRTL